MDSPTLQVTYGDDYRVEFRLTEGGAVEGRYLNPDGPWEHRAPGRAYDDPEHWAVLNAIRTLLLSYSQSTPENMRALIAAGFEEWDR